MIYYFFAVYANGSATINTYNCDCDEHAADHAQELFKDTADLHSVQVLEGDLRKPKETLRRVATSEPAEPVRNTIN